MQFLRTIEERVNQIFEEYPDLKLIRHKKRLVWYYWTKYDGVDAMTFESFQQATDEESILRARRKVLSKRGFKEIETFTLQQIHKEYYAQN